MVKKLLLILALFTSFNFWAQLGGRATYQFLNLVSSPKQAALGGKLLTDYSYDPTSGLFNPATINPENRGRTGTTGLAEHWPSIRTRLNSGLSLGFTLTEH